MSQTPPPHTPGPDASGTGLATWIDRRLPILSGFRAEYIDFRMPINLNGLWNFGAILTILLLLMLASGLFLAMTYTPTAQDAFASIETIERELPSGWLIRGMHMTGASLFMAALYIHIFRGLYYGSYKAPRELLWLTGLVMLLMSMITAFAGYVLPWGQMSYWGADVATKAIGAIPAIGPTLEHITTGSDHLGTIFLHRLFVLHFLMAFGIVAVVVAHVAALHVTGPNNPTGIEPKTERETVPFHPYFTTKDLIGIALFALVFVTLMFFCPDWVAEAENSLPANPMQTPADIEPEWYFLPFYGLLQSVPSKFGGLVAAIGAIAVLFAVPWLDRSPIRSARYRPVFRTGVWVMILSFFLLGLTGKHHAEGIWHLIGPLATLTYFAFYLVLLPLCPRIETTRPLPDTIAPTP